ncbi:hypothetical protein LJC63_01235 [Ruminococcaceae bacterium OttesenSCG-928-L11]|nr:hypothetical protein [Ruminococcaceae bacterium OttesenSCG-928-L11]
MTDKKKTTPATFYRETRIGKTLYRVTSVYLGEKDLKETLEHLAVQHALTEMEAAQATA